MVALTTKLRREREPLREGATKRGRREEWNGFPCPLGIATVLGNEAVTREEGSLEANELGMEERRAAETAEAEQAILQRRYEGWRNRAHFFRV